MTAGGRFATLALALLASCHRAAPPSRPPQAPILEVSIVGRAATNDGDRCARTFDTDVTLLIRSNTPLPPSLALDGCPIEGAQRPSPGPDTWLLSFTAPRSARFLLVWVEQDGAGTEQLIDLRDQPIPWRKEARAAARMGGESGLAIAMPLFDNAVKEARRDGRFVDEVDARMVWAHYLTDAADFARALLVLREAEPALSSYPEGQAIILKDRGVVASKAGRLNEAERLLDEAARWCASLGIIEDWMYALEEQAELRSILGRYDEAAALADEAARLLGTGEFDDCTVANRLNNFAWITLRMPPGERRLSTGQLLAEARRLQAGCPNPNDRGNTLINLALDAWPQDPAAARRHRADARDVDPDPRPDVGAYALLLDGEFALADGRAAAALRLFDELAALAEKLQLKEVGLAAARLRAQALERLGRIDESRYAWDQLESVLDEWSIEVPIGQGRDRFLAGFDAAGHHIDFLLRHGLSSEAAAAARGSRTRALVTVAWGEGLWRLQPTGQRALQKAFAAYRETRRRLTEQAARDRFLPMDRLKIVLEIRRAEESRARDALSDALAAAGAGLIAHPSTPPERPAAGDLLLVYHPSGNGWIGFAITAEGTRPVPLGAVDPRASDEALGVALLEPFAEEIERARRVRIAAAGALNAVGIHALPFRGRPLVAIVPVVYTLDLRMAGQPSTAPSELGNALIVVDPRGNLPDAIPEADRVTRALAAQGFRVTRLDGNEATLAHLVEQLRDPGVRLFHFAGHGVYAGLDGIDSTLLLAASGALNIADIASLGRVPPQVILSACEGARSSTTAAAIDLGLAHAFLLAGARQVIAAARPVPDEVAAALGDLYEGSTGPLDLAELMHRLARGRQGEALGVVRAFRVLER